MTTLAIRSCIAVLFSVALSAPPLHAAEDNRIYVKSTELDPAAAESDAARDFAEGKCRLYAVASYSWYFPETGDQPYTLNARYTAIYISDTSDIAAADDPANARGQAYASAYNRVAIKNCGETK